MKKIISLLAIAFLFTTTVFASPVIEQTQEYTLIRGVEYKNIKGLYESGWQDVHIVTADLSEDHLSLEILKNKNGESYLERTTLSAENNDTVVAVNADFFAAKKGEAGRGSAVGVEIRDGKLYSSASVQESMNTLYKTFAETGFNIDSFVFDITLTAANGLQDKIKLINKYDDLTGIVMYTSDWNDTSVGSIGGIIEIAVDKDGKVLEKVTESEALKIPEDGYVLSAHMSYNTFLLDNVNVGDKIEIDIKSTPDYNKIETAVGGGGVLVRDGVAMTEFSHNVSGKNPRTAIGLDKTGTKMTFVVLDGRRTDARGMTQTELAELMVELGCYTALNFDGGGSSVMVVDEFSQKKVVNTPSDGAVRNVTNSIGITSTLKGNAPLKEIVIKAPKNAFSGFKTHIEAYGIDEYERRVELDGKITYKTDNGKISNGVLVPEKSGTATITVTSGEKSAQAKISVLDAPHEIKFTSDKYEIKSGSTITPELLAYDENGKTASIDLSDVELTSSNEYVKVNDAKVVAVSKGACHITAKIGEITANAQVLVDGAESIGTINNIKIADAKNKSSNVSDGGYRFSVFGNTKNNETLFDMFVMNNATIKMKNTSDFQFFLGGGVNTETLFHVDGTYHTAKEYSCINKNGDTFITLPNATSYIYNDDTSVWTRFQNDVKNSGRNLFIFIDRNFISQNDVEVLMFKQLLEDTAKEKTVYVFGGGFTNGYGIENGVRYVNTAGFFESVTLEGTSLDYVKYLLVTVNGTDVTYEYLQAVER